MQISMSIIASELETYIIQLHIPNRTENKISTFRLLDNHLRELDPNAVYLCQQMQLTTLIQKKINLKDMNIIVYGSDVGGNHSELELCNYMVISNQYSFIYFINVLDNIFVSYNEWEKQVIKMVASKASLQEMLELGHTKIQIPMCALDPVYNVLAITPKEKTSDPLFQAMLDGYGYASMHLIKDCNPTLEEINQTTVSEVINNISHNRLLATAICKGNVPVGYLALHKKDDQLFTESTLELYHFFLTFFREKLIKMPILDHTRNNLFDHFMADLIENKIKDDKNLVQILSYFQLLPQDSYHLIIFKASGSSVLQEKKIQATIEFVEEKISNCRCFYYDYKIGVLLKGYETAKVFSTLNSIIRTTQFQCAVSPNFTQISSISKAWELTNAVFQNWPSEYSHIANTDHIIMAACVSWVQKSIPKETLMHPYFQKLSKYDQENNTDYLRTITCYLQNNCHIMNTAIALYIHRNSLQYRIKKIEELLDCKIASSPQRLSMLFASFFLSDSLFCEED